MNVTKLLGYGKWREGRKQTNYLNNKIKQFMADGKGKSKQATKFKN